MDVFELEHSIEESKEQRDTKFSINRDQIDEEENEEGSISSKGANQALNKLQKIDTKKIFERPPLNKPSSDNSSLVINFDQIIKKQSLAKSGGEGQDLKEKLAFKINDILQRRNTKGILNKDINKSGLMSQVTNKHILDAQNTHKQAQEVFDDAQPLLQRPQMRGSSHITSFQLSIWAISSQQDNPIADHMLAMQRISINKKVDIMNSRFYFSDDGCQIFLILVDPVTDKLINCLVFNGKDLSKLTQQLSRHDPVEECHKIDLSGLKIRSKTKVLHLNPS